VQYQDVVADPVDVETDESEARSELSLRLWQHHDTARMQRLLTPEDVHRTLSHREAPGLHHKAAAATSTPLVHHLPRRHEAHAAHPLETETFTRPRGETAKRVLDVVGAVTLAVLFSPLLLIVGLVVAGDRGPIIYSHSRTGRHGRQFGCLKFRTMVPNAEQALRDLLHRDPQRKLEWMQDQKLRNDPRVTPIGRFLRSTSLDELPQLWNVLKGDMSLVGPRPVVRDEWQRYGRRLDTFLAAKPGVTGLWQVMGRNDCSYRRRVALDTFYVRKRNLLLDVFILLRTVKVVLRGRGAY
jgi:Undecaprenyl-phosphate galactose phosphotransferase WbaP